MHARILDANGCYQMFLLSISANALCDDGSNGFSAAAIKKQNVEVQTESQDLAERNLRFPWGHVPVMAWSTQSDGFLDFVNDRWVRFTGLSLERAQDWGWQAAVPP